MSLIRYSSFQMHGVGDHVFKKPSEFDFVENSHSLSIWHFELKNIL